MPEGGLGSNVSAAADWDRLLSRVLAFRYLRISSTPFPQHKEFRQIVYVRKTEEDPLMKGWGSEFGIWDERDVRGLEGISLFADHVGGYLPESK